jgi:RNA polymerase sigma-70 factor (ECF subfamily)
MTIPELINACITGKRKAQEELYDLYSPKLYGICLRYLSNSDDAKDVLQESMIKVFANLSNTTIQEEKVLVAWLRRITVNTALNFIRSRKKDLLREPDDTLVNLSSEEENSTDGFFDNLMDYVPASSLLKLIQELPVGYRTVFNLYVIENFTHSEISKELNISVNTSKTQLFKARKLLSLRINEILETQSIKQAL